MKNCCISSEGREKEDAGNFRFEKEKNDSVGSQKRDTRQLLTEEGEWDEK